jgi:hypothetical protein
MPAATGNRAMVRAAIRSPLAGTSRAPTGKAITIKLAA